MNTSFETLDYAVFGIYAIVILGVGLWVSRDKKGETKSAEDYFLASKSLPWWAIGASLIAAIIEEALFVLTKNSFILFFVLMWRLPPV